MLATEYVALPHQVWWMLWTGVLFACRSSEKHNTMEAVVGGKYWSYITTFHYSASKCKPGYVWKPVRQLCIFPYRATTKDYIGLMIIILTLDPGDEYEGH